MKKIRYYTFILLTLAVLLLPMSASAFTIFGWSFSDLFGSSLSRGLVGHWTFDGKNMVSNVADTSKNGNNGRLIGQTATTSVFGVLGQALMFDGANDQTFVDSVFGLGNTNVTIATWIYLDSTLRSGSFVKIGKEESGVGNNNGFGLGVGSGTFDGDGNYLVILYEGVRWMNSSPNTIGTGWHHVALTVNDSGTPEWYIDGVFRGTSVGTNALAPVAGGTKLGGYTGIGSENRFVEVILDDTRVYNRTLSAEEIGRLYKMGAKGAKAGVAPPGGTLAAGGNSGLVGHWTFDGKNMVSNVTDSSGQGNTGRLIGQTATTTGMGVLGQAIRFDGTDDYINLGSPSSLDLSPGNTFTLSAWVNPASNPDGAGIISESYNVAGGTGSTVQYELGFDIDSGSPGGKLSGGFYDGGWHTTYDTVRISNDTWTHVAVTWNGSVLELYKNGVSVDTTQTGNPIPSATIGPFLIGRRHDDAGVNDFFPGVIDDARIYNRALSAEEVKRLYTTGTSGIKAGATPSGGTLSANGGLVAHWTFDGKHMISNVADASGQGNNGALLFGVTGNTATTTTFGKIGQALLFDGITDTVDIPYDASFAVNAYTVAAWAKKATSGTDQGVFTTRIGSDLTFDFKLNPTSVHGDIGSGAAWLTIAADCSYTFTPGEWYHIAYAVWQNNYRIYVNGALCIENTFSGTPLLMKNDNTMRIGSSVTFSEYFTGAIDDVRVYNRALSAEEIKRLYTAGQ